MDKISQIVGGSARVGAGDAKSAPPVRPGTPAFGRSIGESPHANRSEMSTAEKVGLIRSDLAEQKRMRAESKIATDMNEQFFFKPEENVKIAAAQIPKGQIKLDQESELEEPTIRATSARTEAMINNEDADLRTPSRFAPRGSYIDVRA
jgi:hypothetical protein